MATASCINSRRDEEAVRGVDRSSPSERRQPPPEGQTFHAAGPSADGWTVIALHESQESW